MIIFSPSLPMTNTECEKPQYWDISQVRDTKHSWDGWWSTLNHHDSVRDPGFISADRPPMSPGVMEGASSRLLAEDLELVPLLEAQVVVMAGLVAVYGQADVVCRRRSTFSVYTPSVVQRQFGSDLLFFFVRVYSRWVRCFWTVWLVMLVLISSWWFSSDSLEWKRNLFMTLTPCLHHFLIIFSDASDRWAHGPGQEYGRWLAEMDPH